MIWGVLIMTSVSAAWVGATHLLKSSFQTVQYINDDDEDVINSTASYNVGDEVQFVFFAWFAV